MFILEMITPVGIITASFVEEVKTKSGGIERLTLPYVFNTKELALQFLKTHVKGKVFAYNIKEFTPYNDQEKI